MIKNWLVTGDTHGRVMERLTNIDTTKYIPSETALIILGDAGINFYLNKTDKKKKIQLQETGYTFFCVHGNHEQRPQCLGYDLEYFKNDDYEGLFYFQPEYPNILYFLPFGLYRLGQYIVYVIGGAYSVDKYYRIVNAPSDNWCGWFASEQLTTEEMLNCQQEIYNLPVDLHIDFVLTHTCPAKWEPRDLFLPIVDQSTVDKSMELWLDEIEQDLRPYKYWLFGHYHTDRYERPNVLQMYTHIENLDDIYSRTDEDKRWFRKSPNYYSGQN